MRHPSPQPTWLLLSGIQNGGHFRVKFSQFLILVFRQYMASFSTLTTVQDPFFFCVLFKFYGNPIPPAIVALQWVWYI